jgi:hypothetical protein
MAGPRIQPAEGVGRAADARVLARRRRAGRGTTRRLLPAQSPGGGHHSTAGRRPGHIGAMRGGTTSRGLTPEPGLAPTVGIGPGTVRIDRVSDPSRHARPSLVGRKDLVRHDRAHADERANEASHRQDLQALAQELVQRASAKHSPRLQLQLTAGSRRYTEKRATPLGLTLTHLTEIGCAPPRFRFFIVFMSICGGQPGRWPAGGLGYQCNPSGRGHGMCRHRRGPLQCGGRVAP